MKVAINFLYAICYLQQNEELSIFFKPVMELLVPQLDM